MSRGLVAEDHSLSLLAARSTALREADVVLVVGTRMNWVYTFGRRLGPSAKFIQIDIHAEEIGHNRDVDLGLVGDARTVVRQLNDAISGDARFSGGEDSEWVAYLREQNAVREERAQELLNSSQVPIHPLRLCKEVRDVIDRDAIVTIDGNEILHYGRQSIPVYYPGHRLNSGPSGCMGVGLPYAIGAKVAKPEVQVVAVHGDGSLGMNLMDFDTAVRHDIPIVVVVSNNEGWTARVEGVRKPGRELGYTRFDRLAVALGGHGEDVREPDEIRPALERALASGKPAIVNVRTDPTARALSRFVGSRME
jgi:acetolactate synthase-1/2/3 large subunit